jgi:hypothetical protein
MKNAQREAGRSCVTYTAGESFHAVPGLNERFDRMRFYFPGLKSETWGTHSLDVNSNVALRDLGHPI